MRTDKSRQMICAHVARILQEERLRQGLSMTEVSVRAGLSQQMVSYVERQMRNPTLDTLLRIADALKIDIATVMTRARKAAAKQQSKGNVD